MISCKTDNVNVNVLYSYKLRQKANLSRYYRGENQCGIHMPIIKFHHY